MDNNNTTQQNGAQNTQNSATQSNTATAGGNNAGTEKMFTQDEVNRIVSERLMREREKSNTEPSPLDKREREITERENKMICKEYIADNALPKELLEIFDTSNAGEFKKATEKMLELFPGILPNSKSAGYTGRGNTGAGHNTITQTETEDKLANIFKN